MQCPQCGTRNPLGSSHCSSCDMPFTREASQQEYGYTPAAYQAGARPIPPVARQRTRRGSCLVSMLVMLVVALGLVIVAFVVADLLIKPRVADVVAANIRTGIEGTVRERVQADLAHLEAGSITISEGEINQRLHEGRDLGPIDTLDINIDPEGISADMSAYGLSGTYAADVVVENGQIRLSNGSIGGPLQYVIDRSEIERVASEAINQALLESGYEITSITLHEGELQLELGSTAS